MERSLGARKVTTLSEKFRIDGRTSRTHETSTMESSESVAKVEGRLWKTGVMPGLIDSPVHRLLQYPACTVVPCSACRAIVLYVLPEIWLASPRPREPMSLG